MPTLVDTQPELERTVALLRDAPALAVDTETDAFFAYRTRICLLQFSIPGHDLLVDPLADLDLDPIGGILADPGREVVLHAAENDVILLHHQFGWRIARLMDTQIAGFVLGIQPYSLAGILEARFDVKMDKSQQRSDWSRRPLRPEQVAYAAEDTRHLLDLAADLHRRAAEAGRTEEIAWECRRVANRAWEPDEFDPEAFRRLNGARDLDPVGLRILRGLYLMRNRESERRNWAPFRIVADGVLVKIARERLTEPGRGVPRGFWRRYGRQVARLVREAPAKGPVAEPRRPRSRSEPIQPATKRRYERLRRWRTAAAEERGVEPFVVARNEMLMRIAQAGCATQEELADLLEPFRQREYGEAILAAARGSDENDTIN